MEYFTFLAIVSTISWNAVIGKSFDVRVVVPTNVATGSTATLFCQFTCDAKKIYSIQWYRGNREFFRFIPSEKPPIKTFDFPVGTLLIDIPASNMTQITLKKVTPILSGPFTCEVTAFPNLSTVSGNKTLYVYDPAYLKKPIIKTEEYILDESRKSTNILCGFDVRRDNVDVSVEKIPFVFYVNQEKIDPMFLVYDDYNGFLILNTSLLRWKDRSEKKISCSANLPGTSGLRSDEVLINTSTSEKLTAARIHYSVAGAMFIVLTKCFFS